jgi:hypothetical protein
MKRTFHPAAGVLALALTATGGNCGKSGERIAASSMGTDERGMTRAVRTCASGDAAKGQINIQEDGFGISTACLPGVRTGANDYQVNEDGSRITVVCGDKKSLFINTKSKGSFSVAAAVCDKDPILVLTLDTATGAAIPQPVTVKDANKLLY